MTLSSPLSSPLSSWSPGTGRQKASPAKCATHSISWSARSAADHYKQVVQVTLAMQLFLASCNSIIKQWQFIWQKWCNKKWEWCYLWCITMYYITGFANKISVIFMAKNVTLIVERHCQRAILQNFHFWLRRSFLTINEIL